MSRKGALLRAGLFFFQAEDGIRYLVRSRGLGDVYKRQELGVRVKSKRVLEISLNKPDSDFFSKLAHPALSVCLLYTSDAADERSSVDLGGRRIIKKIRSLVTLGVSLDKNNNANNTHVKD